MSRDRRRGQKAAFQPASVPGVRSFIAFGLHCLRDVIHRDQPSYICARAFAMNPSSPFNIHALLAGFHQVPQPISGAVYYGQVIHKY